MENGALDSSDRAQSAISSATFVFLRRRKIRGGGGFALLVHGSSKIVAVGIDRWLLGNTGVTANWKMANGQF